MGQDQSSSGAPVTDAHHPDQLREEIDATRQELGDTVEALARKTDVKARARQKLADSKPSVSPIPPLAVGAFGAGFLAGRLTKR